MTTLLDLRACEHPDFSALTFQSFASLVRPPLRPEVTAIGLIDADGTAGGLALGLRQADSARLLSVAVAEPLRGKGLGTRLVRTFTESVVADGARRAVAEVPWSGSNPAPSLVQCFDRLGWRRCGPVNAIVTIAPEAVVQAVDDRKLRTHEAFELVPWDSQSDPAWAPRELRPSRFAPHAPDGRPYARNASFGIYRDLELQGWIISHRVRDRWLRITSHFMRGSGPASAWTFGAWRRYFTLLDRQGWERVTFATSEEHSGFFRFCQRRAPGRAEKCVFSVDYAVDLRGRG